LGERIFKSPGGRGRSWKRTRRRKRERRSIANFEFGVRSSEWETWKALFGVRSIKD
jgi:hypothetical protein